MCSCACLAIFCLAVIVVGLAGGTVVYFLTIAPTSSAQNATNVENRFGNYLNRFQKLQVQSLIMILNDRVMQYSIGGGEEKDGILSSDTGP